MVKYRKCTIFSFYSVRCGRFKTKIAAEYRIKKKKTFSTYSKKNPIIVGKGDLLKDENV